MIEKEKTIQVTRKIERYRLYLHHTGSGDTAYIDCPSSYMAKYIFHALMTRAHMVEHIHLPKHLKFRAFAFPFWHFIWNLAIPGDGEKLEEVVSQYEKDKEMVIQLRARLQDIFRGGTELAYAVLIKHANFYTKV